MDEDTRIAALKKLNGMKSIVAYPDEYMNDSLIERHYSKLEFSPDQYLQNRLNMGRVNKIHRITELREPKIVKNDWTKTLIAVANAFYLGRVNTIGNNIYIYFIVHNIANLYISNIINIILKKMFSYAGWSFARCILQ